MKTRGEHGLRIGPCKFPTYPISAFSDFPPGIKAADVWRIIGPTVEQNINKPLWQQLCAIYIEGLNHGHGIATEEKSNG